jgi:hypothetical protein
MALPRFAAEASLYTASRSYRKARSAPAATAAPTVIAQQDPCALPGGGGGVRPQPMACPVGERCCGIIRDGRCILGPCVAANQACP